MIGAGVYESVIGGRNPRDPDVVGHRGDVPRWTLGSRGLGRAGRRRAGDRRAGAGSGIGDGRMGLGGHSTWSSPHRLAVVPRCGGRAHRVAGRDRCRAWRGRASSRAAPAWITCEPHGTLLAPIRTCPRRHRRPGGSSAAASRASSTTRSARRSWPSALTLNRSRREPRRLTGRRRLDGEPRDRRPGDGLGPGLRARAPAAHPGRPRAGRGDAVVCPSPGAARRLSARPSWRTLRRVASAPRSRPPASACSRRR